MLRLIINVKLDLNQFFEKGAPATSLEGFLTALQLDNFLI